MSALIAASPVGLGRPASAQADDVPGGGYALTLPADVAQADQDLADFYKEVPAAADADGAGPALVGTTTAVSDVSTATVGGAAGDLATVLPAGEVGATLLSATAVGVVAGAVAIGLHWEWDDLTAEPAPPATSTIGGAVGPGQSGLNFSYGSDTCGSGPSCRSWFSSDSYENCFENGNGPDYPGGGNAGLNWDAYETVSAPTSSLHLDQLYSEPLQTSSPGYASVIWAPPDVTLNCYGGYSAGDAAGTINIVEGDGSFNPSGPASGTLTFAAQDHWLSVENTCFDPVNHAYWLADARSTDFHVDSSLSVPSIAPNLGCTTAMQNVAAVGAGGLQLASSKVLLEPEGQQLLNWTAPSAWFDSSNSYYGCMGGDSGAPCVVH